MTTQTPKEQNSFNDLGIAGNIMQALSDCNFTVPTPIQHKCIPIGIEGKDLIGIAQTGTGKTMAFGIPMIQRLARYKGMGLVILPTRELALQVDEAFAKIGGHIGLRTAVLIGGEQIYRQKRALSRKPHILIVTPGRLVDHIKQKTVSLDDVKILVLDEADRMLDMGFAPQINQILGKLPAERQTMLFSATMPQDIVKIAAAHMKLPLRIEVSPAGTASEDVEQEMIIASRDAKKTLLQNLLAQYSGTILIFSRTKHGAKKICDSLRKSGHEAAEIHSNRSLSQRRSALEGFKSGRYRILVATDIASRGIDVNNIEVVINYDLPDHLEDYVHRIGRTGRAGKEGRAITFVMPDEINEIKKIERMIRKSVKVSHHQPGTSAQIQSPSPKQHGHPQHRHQKSAHQPKSHGHSRFNKQGGFGKSGFGRKKFGFRKRK